MCEIAVLGLGTNKAFGSLSGQDLLAEACKALSLVLSGMKKSSVYRTKPMYVVDQPDFFNMVVAGEFEGSAADLLLKIHEIEAQFGRNRAKEIRFGQRTLDIDIELFGSQKISSDSLEIPHPRLLERDFVLVPLVELLKNGAVSMPNSEIYIDALTKRGVANAEKIEAEK